MATFTAVRREPELVKPARATPGGVKQLSDIDNQRNLRFYSTLVEFFRGESADVGLPRRDPVPVIRSALAEALVYYYPVAGRLRELTPPDGRLLVDCKPHGVIFVEADAAVSLAELGEPLLPTCQCVDELRCHTGDTKIVVDKPLCFIQVTRFQCGGFAVGIDWCHSMQDGFGICNFVQAIGDLARGEPRPLVLPVWEREILTSHGPPFVTRPLLGYEPLGNASRDDVMLTTPLTGMVGRYFIFGPAQMAALRSRVHGSLGQCCTAFDLLSATLWRCRTAALEYAAEQRVRFMFTSNARRGWKRNPPIPAGYYGCAFVLPVAETAAGKLCSNPLAYAVQLVRNAKHQVGEDYMSDTLDFLRSRKWPSAVADWTFDVSDITSIGEGEIDFGWGKRIGGGIPMTGDVLNFMVTYFMKLVNVNGEDSYMVPLYLPKAAMDRFEKEIASFLV